MRNYCATMLKVKKLSVGNFHHRLANNVISCPGKGKYLLVVAEK